MTQTAARTVLITGANAGIGKDVARQLAAGGDAGKIYLACRNQEKAQAAQEDLEAATGRQIFEIVAMDMSDLHSVRAAAASITEPLDALVMNAGGTGGPAPRALTQDGVTYMFASNVLGHVVLAETLLKDSKLTEVAVYVGSEAARGVPKLRIPRPAFMTSSAGELASAIDGSYFSQRKYTASLAYGQAKYLAALWMGALAREHPGLRFITMSPGNTAGTEAFSAAPAPLRVLVQRVLMPIVAPALGIGHQLEDGAGRIVDAVTDASLRSGVFYASAASTLTGPVTDQATIFPDLADPAIQDNANEAIHRFAA
jgi:NAD(P)-dependent dehydrogenase (short-subunit alcohol dehydrogenase family)